MAKGSNYEGEICKQLSKWWLGTDTDEIIFWRSHGSGGWAHRRSKKGGQTAGQHGDISAVDPRGQDLIDAFAIEIKRGHNKAVLIDLFDRPMRGSVGRTQQTYDKWFEQVITSWEQSGAFSWLLIHKRDCRQAMIYFLKSVYRYLQDLGAFSAPVTPFIEATIVYTSSAKAQSKRKVVGMLLEDFLVDVQPKHIRLLAQS